MPCTKVIDLELTHSLTLPNLNDYAALQALIKFRGTPIGMVHLPVSGGASPIAQAILPDYNQAISRKLVQDRIAHPELETWAVEALLDCLPSQPNPVLPAVTVAFCPRHTDPDTLDACLNALQQLNDAVEILVVEANPQTNDLRRQVQPYANLHYLSTPATGLNAARNLAIEQAQGEIIAFTDERGLVDSTWVKALATTFADHPEVTAVAGLVVPHELETEPQIWWDTGYGSGRGCERKWYRLDPTQPVDWTMLGTMQIGSGVNMAYRRRIFDQVGRFDPALTQDGDGGDWDMFCRLLLSGQTLLYEPAAVVRYQASRSYERLRSQLTQETSAFFAYVQAGISRYPDQWLNFVWLGCWKLARLMLAYLRPGAVPRDLITAEWQGIGHFLLTAFSQDAADRKISSLEDLSGKQKPLDQQIAVRLVDLEQPLPDLTDVEDYRSVRVFVTVGHIPIGSVDIEHRYQSISAARLRQSIADHLWLELLALPHAGDKETAWAQIQSVFTQRWMPSTVANTGPKPFLPTVPVSIIITTCDRPTELANCLRHLQSQQTARPVEIIVADNRPSSGLTQPVVAQFPGVKLVSEPRPGASYGRNAAITASSGEIIVSIDDDVTVPPGWLEKLIAPFVRPEVMVVTGNVLPLELDTPAQVMFETLKGGLGEGFQPFEVDRNWWASFHSPPTWELGVSANAAFRAAIFHHPMIGLMDEVLGPGTPTGGGEENHLIYKVLRAGYTLVYEPAAFVWHQHRRDLSALYRQLQGHMKGGTAYHLLLWLQEQDRRSFRQLAFLPRYYTIQIIARLRGQHQTPWRLLWSEVAGYFAGYWGYWQSCQRVKQQGRSAPYIPVSQRAPDPTISSSLSHFEPLNIT